MQFQKARMARRRFRIGELAKELKVKKFVIRFWEKEFDFKSDRSNGGQRYYTQEDLMQFITIKDLLYNQGYTIAGAKSKLSSPKKVVPFPSSTTETLPAVRYEEVNKDQSSSLLNKQHQELIHQLATFKDRLLKFRKLIS